MFEIKESINNLTTQKLTEKFSNSIIKYGLEPNTYNYTGQGYSTSYYESFHHHVVLSDNLKPIENYFIF